MSGKAFLILSGKYVGADLVAEFGQLPPSMLPNGGRPLYEAQCDMADALGASMVLVLPHEYEVPRFDRDRLNARAVTVIASPPRATIVQSLLAGLAAVEDCEQCYILFGDTLVPGREAWPIDSFAAGMTDHVAFWAEYDDGDGASIFREAAPGKRGGSKVVAGFFHIGDLKLLVRCAANVTELTGLLNAYVAHRPLTPVTIPTWLDFGHLFTYHQSRCRELRARSFNSVTSDGTSVIKSGTPPRKIFAEAEWYDRLPPRLRPFAPQFMGKHEGDPVSYELEYLYLPLMSELYSFARLPVSTWETMLDSCSDFLEIMQSITPPEHRVPVDYPQLFFDDMIGAKTWARINAFAADRGLSVDRQWTFNGRPYLSLARLADLLTGMIRPTRQSDVGIWHGDFHFGNIFYDFRSRKVRVVDPRGQLSNGMLTIYGDARYDISKLGHSVFGLYDALISDRFELAYDGTYEIALDFGSNAEREEIIAIYSRMKLGQYASFDREAIAMVALLFLSMLPLHAKDERRQIALLGNAMRLAQMAEAA